MNTFNPTWQHIILGFLAWGLLVIGLGSCMVMENEAKIRELQEERSGYLIISRDTVYTKEGDTLYYETRIYNGTPGSNKRQR